MADGLYVAMAGAVARSEQLDTIADNLANAQTPGFKAARAAFQTFLPKDGEPELAYPGAVATGVDLRPGPMQVTGNPLDATPDGGLFYSVRLASGEVAYTRNGHLSVDGAGQLRAGGGLVLDPSGEPLMVPAGATPELGRDGSLRVSGAEVGRIALFRLEGAVERRGNHLLGPARGGFATLAEGKLRLGEVELSNAPALEAAISMVNAQRHYDTSMQAIQTYRRLDERAQEVGKVR